MTYRGLDNWIEGDPDAARDAAQGRPDEGSALAKLGIDGLGYVLNQYIDDVRYSSTLSEGQKARRIEMIEAAIADFGE